VAQSCVLFMNFINVFLLVQAFKFPDVMDLTLECNVELCKTDCESCPVQGQV
jgi:hypothetical protein